MATKMPTPSKGFWNKHSFGDLPNWAWGGLIIGALVVISVWSKNKKAAQAAQQATINGQPLPGNIVPQYTFVDESTAIINTPQTPASTPPPSPPAGPPPGPVTPPDPNANVVPEMDPFLAVLNNKIDYNSWYNQYGDPRVGTSTKGEWVTADNGKYNSISAIAQQVYGKAYDTGGAPGYRLSAASIGYARQNQQLLQQRFAANGTLQDFQTQLQPGDKVWVPAF